MQVVTSENFQTLIEKGSVPEFKAPDAKDAKPVEPEKVEQKADDSLERDPVTGQFVKREERADVTADKEKPKIEADKTSKDVDDEDDADLPERVRRQIGKKHRQMKEAEEFARQLYGDKTAAEQRAEKLERELNALRNPQGSTKTSSNAPKPEDYKTNAEYIDAMVEYKYAEKERAEQERRNNEAQAQAQAAFIDRLNTARKEIPDFDEVVGDADVDVVPHIASYIAESELGPKLGYHFAKHPEELERISKLSPIRGIAELGKLETRLESKSGAKAEPAKDAEPVKVSQAPSPITPVDASAKSVVQKDPAKMTFQELREYDRQQREKRR